MPLPIIPDVYRCGIRWEAPSASPPQYAVNVIHVHDASGVRSSANIASTIAAALPGGVTAGPFTAMTSLECDLVSVSAQKLDGVDTGALEVLTSPIFGQASGQFVPQVAQVVTLYTAVRGRSGRGRMYMPFVAESVATEGKGAATQVAEVELGWQDIASSLSSSGVPMGVASYTSATFHPVTRVVAQPVLGTQRRRQSRLR